MLICYLLAATIVTAFWALLLIFDAVNQYINQQSDSDSFIAGFLIVFAMSSILLFPVTIYMLRIRTGYKKVVEYNTAEWKRLHN